MNDQRTYTQVDHAIMGISRMMETLCVRPRAVRDYPAKSQDSESMSQHDKERSGRYMRVNHVGEICAQALYHSQALTARNRQIQAQMERAGLEENDHLAWCQQRLEELGARKSLLNPLWYAGAFTIGAAAGIAGDRWNLGFVAETERQVVKHLEQHLGKLPDSDKRSREVVEQMRRDENAHANAAVEAGAAELPAPARGLMHFASRVMVNTAHWI